LTKGLPAIGIYGYYSTGGEWVKVSVDANGKIQITSTDLTSILTEVQHATYGLEAIKDAVDAIGTPATPANVWAYATRTLTDPASYKANVTALALEATLTAIKGTSWSDETLKAIKDVVDAIPTTAMRGTDNAMLAASYVTERGTDNAALASSLTTHDTDIKADIGDFSGQTNLTTLLAALGIPDVSGKSLYTCLITDRLDNATYGLSALEDKVDDLESRLTSTRAGYLDQLDFNLAEYLEDLRQKATDPSWSQDTDSLEAISEAVAAIPTTAMRGTDSAALATSLTTHDTDIKADIGDFSAQTNLTTLLAALGIPDVSAKSLYTCLITDRLDSATFGLSKLKDYVDLIDDATNGLAAIKAEVEGLAGAAMRGTDSAALASNYTSTRAGYIDKIPRVVCHMDFWSLPLQVTITSTAGDRGLVDIVVSGLPSGITIIAAQGMFLCDSVQNSYDGINYLESTKIQVKVKTTGTDRDAITLEANKIFRFSDDMIRGGTVLIADWASATHADILTEVAGNATYQMWFDVGEAVQNNIVLDGAQFGLRIWFSV